MIYVNFVIFFKIWFRKAKVLKPHALKTEACCFQILSNQTASFTFCANSQCHSWHRIIADSNEIFLNYPLLFIHICLVFE